MWERYIPTTAAFIVVGGKHWQTYCLKVETDNPWGELQHLILHLWVRVDTWDILEGWEGVCVVVVSILPVHTY